VGVSTDDGYIEQIHFDFRDAGNLAGSMFLDVNPALDLVLYEGDFNGDGSVNPDDYTLWANDFAQMGSDLPADGNGDGVVGPEDYTLWANDFGGESGPLAAVAASAVPEPSSAAVLMSCLVCLAFGGRTITRRSGRRRG